MKTIDGYDAVGEREINKDGSLQSLMGDLETLVSAMDPGVKYVRGIVYANESTPIIDASILNELLLKAMVRTGRPIKGMSVQVDLDNTSERYGFELHSKRK